ncbi:MAG: sigma-70 family RNA polymerase sigma factor [Actinomycetota bacterium]
MSDFRPLSENELAALSTEELIGYHHEGRRLGRHAEARTALGILVWGFQDRVHFWVSRAVPRQDVEDIAGTVFESALKSSFEGTQPAQFGAWLREISHRRATDYHRRAERRPKEEPLPEEHEREEEIWGTAGEVPDPAEAVVERSVSQQALAELGEAHRQVVELAGPVDLGFDGRPAKETAAMINDQLGARLDDPMTDVNVHKVLSRFRRRCREILEASDPKEPDDG